MPNRIGRIATFGAVKLKGAGMPTEETDTGRTCAVGVDVIRMTAGSFGAAILDKCLTVPYDLNNGAQAPQTERGNQ